MNITDCPSELGMGMLRGGEERRREAELKKIGVYSGFKGGKK